MTEIPGAAEKTYKQSLRKKLIPIFEQSARSGGKTGTTPIEEIAPGVGLEVFSR